jgi:DNA-binding response OmpR family regulator
MIDQNDSSHSPQKFKSVYVMLLDDDEWFRESILAPCLRQFGFEVDTIGCAADLSLAIEKRTPNIVLLDIDLSDSDGFTVTRRLRNELPETGVVILSARAENTDLVRSLNEGADAYLVKPVDTEALVATLLSVARRLRPRIDAVKNDHRWRIGSDGWVLISPAGVQVTLTQAERRVLELLMRYPGKVVSRDALSDALSKNPENFNLHRVDSQIHRLRKKILEKTGEPFPLDSVHGTGYTLAIR